MYSKLVCRGRCHGMGMACVFLYLGKGFLAITQCVARLNHDVKVISVDWMSNHALMNKRGGEYGGEKRENDAPACFTTVLWAAEKSGC